MGAHNSVTKERLISAIISRTEMRAQHFKEAAYVIGGDGALELEAFYDIYDERLYIWLATLYDPIIGGFYFSASGRDTEGFLPDIESTVQALRFMETSGLFSGRGETYAKGLPEGIRASLVGFAKSLQAEDGFFYHPQWGRLISTSRRGRDLRWATDMLSRLGEETPYLTPIDTSDRERTAKLLPEYLRDINKWKKYLSDMDMASNSYYNSNLLSSQTWQIHAAGAEFEDALFEFLADTQNPENGLWEPNVSYSSVNGLMKLTIMYSNLRRVLPHSEEAMKSALTTAMSSTPIVFCCQFYNPFEAMGNILENMGRGGEAHQAEKLRRLIIERAVPLIRTTKEKVLTCKRVDGSFSYNPDPRSRLSQRAPVGMGLDEGDINAAAICSSGTAGKLCKSFGIPKIPMFCEKDSDIFFDMLENAVQAEKTSPRPDWFDEVLSEQRDNK